MVSNLIALTDARRCGNSYQGFCPAHNGSSRTFCFTEKTPGFLLYYCFSPRCDRRHLTTVMYEHGVVGTSRRTDTWNWRYSRQPNSDLPYNFFPKPCSPKALTTDEIKKQTMARTIFSQTIAIWGTPGEVYFRARKISRFYSKLDDIRFHPNLLYFKTGHHFPAIVCAMRTPLSSEIQCIFRIYLRRDGTWKADVEPNKMVLGPSFGASIQLSQPSDKLVITEGLEDALTLQMALHEPVWACAGSSMKHVILPILPAAKKVIIGADKDENNAGQTLAQDTKRNLTRENRLVTIVYPQGAKDFNEMLMKGLL